MFRAYADPCYRAMQIGAARHVVRVGDIVNYDGFGPASRCRVLAVAKPSYGWQHGESGNILTEVTQNVFWLSRDRPFYRKGEQLDGYACDFYPTSAQRMFLHTIRISPLYMFLPPDMNIEAVPPLQCACANCQRKSNSTESGPSGGSNKLRGENKNGKEGGE